MQFSAHPSLENDRVSIRNILSSFKYIFHNLLADQSHPNQSDYLLRYHMIVCESHRQMLATALGVLSGEIKDLRTEETRHMVDEMLPW